MSPEAKAIARYDWPKQARKNQLPPPGDWFIWYIEAGRGWGKDRTGAEWIRARMESGKYHYHGIVGPTISTTRNIMVEGPAGILAVCPPWNKPKFNASVHKIVWPNGAICEVFSAEDPDRLRGANLDGAYAGEIGIWNDAEPLDMLLLCVRLGSDPRVVVAGTPKPVPHVKNMPKLPNCITYKGSTYENRFNLSPQFLAQIDAQYRGTRLERQEIYGEVLEDVEGALWTQDVIDKTRVTKAPLDLIRIGVAIDPEAGAGETGINVAATAKVGGKLHAYILDDPTMHGSPDTWAKAAWAAYYKFKADVLIYEKNQGGEMVESTLRTVDKSGKLKDVWASRGKQTRAEPVAALYEQGRVHHVGYFGDLESEMCGWVPGMGMASPNRMDALVWNLTELMLEDSEFAWGSALLQALEEKKATAQAGING